MADWQLWPWSKWREWGCNVVNWWVGYDGGVPLLRIDLLPSEPGSALKWSRKHRMQMEQTRKELTRSRDKLSLRLLSSLSIVILSFNWLFSWSGFSSNSRRCFLIHVKSSLIVWQIRSTWSQMFSFFRKTSTSFRHNETVNSTSLRLVLWNE